jgi:hypothetical protein
MLNPKRLLLRILNDLQQVLLYSGTHINRRSVASASVFVVFIGSAL